MEIAHAARSRRARVPLADFETLASGCGILSFNFMGRIVYRKADIQAAMERAWRLSTCGPVAAASSGCRSVVVMRLTRMRRIKHATYHLPLGGQFCADQPVEADAFLCGSSREPTVYLGRESDHEPAAIATIGKWLRHFFP